MGYQISWKPQFSKQAKAISSTEDFASSIDSKHLDMDHFDHPKNLSQLLQSLCRPNLATFGQILAVSFFVQILTVGSVLLVTDTLKASPWLAFAWMAGLYLGIRCLQALLTNWTILKGNRVAAEMTGSLIMRLGHQIALLSPDSHKKFSSGNLKTMAITDAQTVGELIHSLASRGAGFLLAPLIAPFTLYYLAGWPGIWAYFSMLLMIPLSIIASKKMMTYFNSELTLEDECTTVAGEWLKHQKTVRMMQAGNFFQIKIGHLKRSAFAKAKTGMYWAAFIFGSVTRWWVVPPVAMIMSSGYLGVQLSTDLLIGSVWYISLLTLQLTSIPDLIIRGGKALAAFRRLSELLKEPRLRDVLVESASSLPASHFNEIHLKQVSLKVAEKEILRAVDLVLNLKGKTAVVGQIGSGKSSLLSILSGHIFPTEGEVYLVNGNHQWNLHEKGTYDLWRKQHILVAQEPFIEASSIHENVRLGNLSRTASDDDVLQSLYDAAMQSDIERFRQGVNEPLGETGINLSGGQKQRLSFARALHSSRPFLILDDPLSAVDEKVADQIWESIESSSSGFLISTHRIKYIESCDHVIVIEDGRIVDIASPKQLINQGHGLFFRLRERAAIGALK